MSENHWMKFYPGNWRSDMHLRSCSIAARGLWLEMLCIMHSGEPYGHLCIQGVPMKDTELAAQVAIPLKECRKLLAELEAKGVFSTVSPPSSSEGCSPLSPTRSSPSSSAGKPLHIYSRRMVRDHAKALKDKENGKSGGNPRLKGGVNPLDKAYAGEARSQKLEATPSGVAAGARASGGIEAGSEAGSENPTGSPLAGVQRPAATSAPIIAERQPPASVEQSTVFPDPKSVPDFIRRTLEANPDMGANAASSLALLSPQELNLWVAKGYDLAMDIEPAITSWLARPGRRAPKTWGYFRGIVEEYREKRLSMPQAAILPAMAAPVSKQNPDGTRKPDSDGKVRVTKVSPVDQSRWSYEPHEDGALMLFEGKVRTFLARGTWDAENLGAPPGHPACLIPAEWLARWMPTLPAAESPGSTAHH